MNLLGLVVCRLGDADKGLDLLRKAIGVNVEPAYYSNLGVALKNLGRLDEALQAYRDALALKPDLVEVHTNVGSVLRELKRPHDAAAACRAALALKPQHGKALYNLAVSLQDMQRFSEAVTVYRRACVSAPNDADARFNLGCLLLLQGQFEEGWREYEWRWKLDRFIRHDVSGDQWFGQDLAGRTILLHAEQGLGDTLQFVRYVPQVARRGGRVVLEVQHSLVNLVRRMEGVERVIAQGDPRPDHDLHCPLVSLPLAFGTRLDDIPAEIPYLQPDPERLALWQSRVSATRALKVGLVWAGNPRLWNAQSNAIDRRRSISLAHLAPLAAVPGVRFYSLQKGDEAAAQAKAPPAGLEVIDLMDEVDDFADTTALMKQLDLVIGVDTSTIHLAGALGIPVWVLSRFDGCWRWLLDRDDSPWYPTLRLYRQDKPGCWEPVIERLARDLGAHAAMHRSMQTP